MNILKKSPAFAAAFSFILTWVAFPVAALISSQIKGITFAAACCRPYIIASFALGSIIAAFSTYNRTKNKLER